MVKGRLSIKMKKKELTVSEQMQDELEPIMHSHPTEYDESDDLEMVKDTQRVTILSTRILNSSVPKPT
jgi:hypothetical protein